MKRAMSSSRLRKCMTDVRDVRKPFFQDHEHAGISGRRLRRYPTKGQSPDEKTGRQSCRCHGRAKRARCRDRPRVSGRRCDCFVNYPPGEANAAAAFVSEMRNDRLITLEADVTSEAEASSSMRTHFSCFDLISGPVRLSRSKSCDGSVVRDDMHAMRLNFDSAMKVGTVREPV
jgi:hypothetical protein